MSQINPDLLQEFEQPVDLTPVSPGLRFVNFLIDVVAFYALSFIIGVIVGLFIAAAAISSETYNDQTTTRSSEDGAYIQLLLLFGWIAILFAYYTLFEYFAKGRTLGKLVTGTLAVREDGSALTFKDAFLRTLYRFIPFEAFSAFGYRPWHDSIANTLVIKKPKRY